MITPAYGDIESVYLLVLVYLLVCRYLCTRLPEKVPAEDCSLHMDLMWSCKCHDSIIATADCNSEVKSICYVTGRCALFNVKLHFSDPNAQNIVTVPPIGPDELPPPYTPSPSGGIPMINCKVCQSMINIEGKTHQHVVKCTVCNEATVSISSSLLGSNVCLSVTLMFVKFSCQNILQQQGGWPREAGTQSPFPAKIAMCVKYSWMHRHTHSTRRWIRIVFKLCQVKLCFHGNHRRVLWVCRLRYSLMMLYVGDVLHTLSTYCSRVTFSEVCSRERKWCGFNQYRVVNCPRVNPLPTRSMIKMVKATSGGQNTNSHT